MLLLHPLLQLLAIIVCVYVLYLGIQRFRMLHLKHKVRFQWKRHVTLGTVVICLLLGGMVGGLTIVRIYWYRFLMTGIHGKAALIMVPFLLFGLLSGLYMNRIKRKRKVLPLLHGVNNGIILLLALGQIATGIKVYYDLVLSY
jgi:hypothetical protein